MVHCLKKTQKCLNKKRFGGATTTNISHDLTFFLICVGILSLNTNRSPPKLHSSCSASQPILGKILKIFFNLLATLIGFQNIRQVHTRVSQFFIKKNLLPKVRKKRGRILQGNQL